MDRDVLTAEEDMAKELAEADRWFGEMPPQLVNNWSVLLGLADEGRMFADAVGGLNPRGAEAVRIFALVGFKQLLLRRMQREARAAEGR